jgi:DNA-binding transcriptional LysR family regulator
MELRQLHYFIAVAEELHFGRAAERLGITQPPLSQQIRALEDAIGARLFNRTNRRVELTESGRLFLAESRAILARLDDAVEQAARAHRGEIGELRLGFTVSAPFTAVFSRSIYAFRQSHPDVRLALEELNTVDQIEALMERRLHVGLIRPTELPEALTALELMLEPMVIAMRSDHPLAQYAPGEALPLAAFADDDFVMFPRTLGIPLYEQIIALFRHAGFTPRVAQEAREASTQIALVAAGFGVAILPALQQRIQLDNVTYRAIADPEARTAVWWPTARMITRTCCRTSCAR